MKKNLLFYFLALTALISNAQSWSPTNITNVTYLPVTAAEFHKGELYATMFNGFTGVLYKLQPGNKAWDAVLTGSIAVPRFLKSAGSKLYMSSVESGVASMVYSSADNAANFTADTLGLPQTYGYAALVYGLQYFDGKIIANTGSAGYYLKDTSETAWRAIPVVTALNGGIDPLTGVHHTLFAYDNTGTKTLYKSDSYGSSWDAVTTNLPVDYGTSKLIGDESTGRLYSAGTWDNSSKYGLYYSDDMGTTWTLSAEAAPFLNKNAGGGLQAVTAMYADGNRFYMALENNTNSSSPDIAGTTTGLANLAWDTLGLPVNAASSVSGTAFLADGDKFALQLNTTDVYLKGGSGSTAVNERSFTGDIRVYPNPFADRIEVAVPSDRRITRISLFDEQGRLILSEINGSGVFNTASLHKGIYIIVVSLNDNSTIRRKLIK